MSKLPETATRPFGVRLTAVTPSVCPSSVRRQRPVATSQTRSVMSLLPETATRPSGVRPTADTTSVCPFSVRRQRLPRTTSVIAAAICCAPRSSFCARFAASDSRARVASSSPRSSSTNACKYGASQTASWLAHARASLARTISSANRPSCQSSSPWLYVACRCDGSAANASSSAFSASAGRPRSISDTARLFSALASSFAASGCSRKYATPATSA